MDSSILLQEDADQLPMATSSVYIVSGGVGASGEQLVQTVLAQFGRTGVPIQIVPRVRSEEKIAEVIERVTASHGIIVHTLVNSTLRRFLDERAQAAGIPAIDLVGPLMSHLEELLQKVPVGQPGLYRQLNYQYFSRIEAMEFTMKHDDGERPAELPQAEIVLLGISRVGKTPLSMYLSVLGWKVANVPLVPGVAPPPELFQVEKQRVIGLVLDPLQVRIHRRWRQKHMGIPEGDYVDQVKIGEELREAQRF
jgi:regulator of PEP synthase PpsR (kinase-PPPase family)